MYIVSSEQVIGSYAVKYKTLTELINKEYAGSSAETINIFIDLTGILRSITSQPVTCKSAYSITASIINLCAHYRNFFAEYYKVHTRFFIILSVMDPTVCINAKFVPGYCRFYTGNNPKINTTIGEALTMLEILCPYIEDLAFYRTDYEFGVFVYDILQYEAKIPDHIVPGLVLSKDPYNFQMVSDDAFMVKILRPKKLNGEDLSYMINMENVLDAMFSARKTDRVDNGLNPSLIPLIYALSRVPERNVQSIHQLPSVVKALNTAAVVNKVIMNDRTTEIEYVCGILKKNKWLNVNDPKRISDRFNAIDIETQYSTFKYTSVFKYNGMINLYDNNAVKEISMKYFKDCPLDLNVL